MPAPLSAWYMREPPAAVESLTTCHVPVRVGAFPAYITTSAGAATAARRSRERPGRARHRAVRHCLTDDAPVVRGAGDEVLNGVGFDRVVRDAPRDRTRSDTTLLRLLRHAVGSDAGRRRTGAEIDVVLVRPVAALPPQRRGHRNTHRAVHRGGVHRRIRRKRLKRHERARVAPLPVELVGKPFVKGLPGLERVTAIDHFVYRRIVEIVVLELVVRGALRPIRGAKNHLPQPMHDHGGFVHEAPVRPDA